MDVRNILSNWTQVECVKFAVWCARSVQHLNNDPRVEAAIKAAEQWLRDPSEASRSVAYAAAAANAAYAAYAAYAAAYAAYAASSAAAASAADAAAAANAAGSHTNLTDRDLLQIYMGELMLNAANA